jgi:hypothetical protein
LRQDLVRRVHDDQRIDAENEIADQPENGGADTTASKADSTHAAPVLDIAVAVTLIPFHGAISWPQPV